MNYGIVTGDGFVVIDIDGPEGLASLKELEAEHGSLRDTQIVLTSRGRHLWFRHEGPPIKNSAGRLAKGIDVRGEGGYVVGPGSVHETGHVYGFEPGHSPCDLPRGQLPVGILKVLNNRQTDTPHAVGQAVCEGDRNTHLTSVAGSLHNAGLSVEQMTTALQAENVRACSPPLDTTEVEKIAESISRYPVHETTDEGEQVARLVLNSKFAGGDHLLHGPDGRFWSFVGTHWRPLAGNTLSGIIFKIVQQRGPRKGQNTSSLLSQVLKLLEASCARDDDPLRFQAEPLPVINARSHELWLQDDGSIEARPHSATSYLRSCLDIDYDPSAKCPIYDRTLLQIFAKSGDPKKMANFFDEMAGYAVQPRRPRGMIILCQGGGANGKTLFLQVLVRVLGNDLVVAMPIDDLEKSRFAIASLDGKLLFVDDDVKAGTRLPDGPLKKIAEEKVISAERKYGPVFSFTVRTLPILLMNNPPSIVDLSYGLRRRLTVLPFLRKFDDGEADLLLFDKIVTGELPGVLNRYLEGLQRVVRNKWDLAKPIDVQRATDFFVEQANPLPAFIAEECEKDGWCWAAELFSRYQGWCQESGITYAQQRGNFTKNLKHLSYEVVHGNKGDKVNGLRYRGSPSH